MFESAISRCSWNGVATALTSFCLVLSFSLTAHAQSKDECLHFAAVPETLFSMRLSEARAYPDRKYGVYAKYNAKREVFTVFKYDAGIGRIEDMDLTHQFRSSDEAIERGASRRGDKILKTGQPFVWRIGGVRFRGVVHEVTYKKHDLTAFEYVGLSHNSTCFLKFRYTDADGAKPAESLKRFKSYVREAQELFE